MAKLVGALKSIGVLSLLGLLLAAQVEDASFRGEWRVRPVESGPSAVPGVLRFDRRSEVRLETRCSVYEGYYRRGLGSVAIDLGETSKACVGDAALLASLNGAARYRYGLQSIVLKAPDGGRLRLFRP
ncbi:MAG: META domain-containing protein [Caulobacter sp.]